MTQMPMDKEDSIVHGAIMMLIKMGELMLLEWLL